MHYFLLLILIAFQVESTSNEWLIDFGKQDSDAYWGVQVDGVMGGLSTGRSVLSDSSLIFTGDISLRNNGGFSSLRSQYGRYDLARFDSVEIRIRLTGQQFSFTLAKDRRFWVPNYKSEIINESENWKTHVFSLDNFKEYRVGNPTGDMINENIQSRIIEMGFINEGKKEGVFTLELDYVRFF